MAGGPVIGHGRVIIEAEQQVGREIAKAKAAFDRGMRDMDRKRASMVLDANLAPLQKKLEDAERKVKHYKRKVEEDAELGVDTKNAERNLKTWERKLQQRRVARDEVDLSTEKARKQLAALQKMEDDRAEAHRKLAEAHKRGAQKMEAAYARVAAAAKKAADDEAAAAKKAADAQAKEAKRAADAKVRESKRAADKQERDAARAAAAEQRRIDAADRAVQKDRANTSVLLQDYAKLQRRIAALNRTRRGTFAGRVLPSRRASLDLDINAAKDKANQLEERLQAAGVDRTRFIDIQVREQNTGALHRLVKGFSDASVRLGPFTTSIGSAARGLTLLAPVIVSVIGSMGALLGVLGSATGGALGLGAAMGGFLPLFGGIAAALNPLVGEFVDAGKAQEKLAKAQLQYGKGSKEAKKAQEQLNQILKNMDPAAAQAVRSMSKLKERWKDLTQSTAREQFGKVVGGAMKTANANVGMFAEQTNRAMKTVGGRLSSAFKGLRTPASMSRLSRFFSNLNNSLGPLIDGFGNLGVALGRVMLSFSRGSVMGRMVKDFEAWTEGVRKGAEDTDSLNSKVTRMAESFRNVVSFTSAALRVLKNFFGAGVKPGNELLKDMTKGLNDLADSLEKPGKRRELQENFRDMASTTKQFWEALKPILSLFTEWATIMRPVAHAMLAIIEPIADLSKALMDLAGVRAAIIGLFSVLLAARIGRGLRNMGREVALLGRSLRNLRVPPRVAAFFGRGKSPKAPVVAGTPAGGGKGGVVPTVGAGGGSVGIQSVRIVGPLPVPVTVVGGAGGAGGRGGGKGPGGPVIIPGGGIGPDPKDAPKARGKFRTFLAAVMAGIRKIPGASKLGALLGGAFTAGRGAVSGIASKIKGALGAAVGQVKRIPGVARIGTAIGGIGRAMGGPLSKLGGFFKGALGRTLGGGIKAIPKVLGKAVPVLGWSWLIHDLLPDTPRKFIDDKIKKGFEGVKSAAKAGASGVSTAWDTVERGATSAWNGVSNGASKAFEAIKRNAGVAAAGALAAMNPLKRLKLGGKVVTSIVARGGDKVNSSLASLSKAKLPQKVQEIKERGGQAVRNMLNRIKGISLGKKIQQIAEKGASVVRGAINKIKGLNLPRKVQSLAEKGSNVVRGAINRIKGMGFVRKTQQIAEQGASKVIGVLGRIRSIAAAGANFVIRVTASIIGGAKKLAGKLGIGAQGLDGAASIRAAAQGDDAQAEALVQNALQTGARRRPTAAQQTPMARATGQVIHKPTLLTGEETHREYVVSSNPAYKKRNRRIVQRAAQDLGLDVVQPAAQGKSHRGRRPAPARGGGDSRFKAGGEFQPDASIARPPVFKNGKKGAKKPYTSKRGWAAYIEGLQEQQGQWEREVSIRESQVREPRDMVIEVGKQDVRDPATGEVTSVPVYGPNPKIESEYKPDLQRVMQAMQTLMSIVQQLVAMIPQAIAANRQERSYHNSQAANLTKEISKENRRREPRRERISKLKDRRDEHRENAKTLAEDEKRLGVDRVDAGFDLREFAIAYGKVKQEHDTAHGEAAAEAATATAQEVAGAQGGGGGGAGGGGVSDPGSPSEPQLSYGAQTMIRDTERANLLREYGGNAYSTSPGGAGPAGVAGGGMQTNPAYMNSGSRTTGGMARSMAMGGYGGGYSTSPSSGGGSTAPSGGDKTINITNNYQTQPENPHLWSEGMAFEANNAF